jgi:hypothetical protein
MMPELFHCPECVVRVERFGELVECPKLLVEGEDGVLRVAPAMTQWMMAGESPDLAGDEPSGSW